VQNLQFEREAQLDACLKQAKLIEEVSSLLMRRDFAELLG